MRQEDNRWYATGCVILFSGPLAYRKALTRDAHFCRYGLLPFAQAVVPVVLWDSYTHSTYGAPD